MVAYSLAKEQFPKSIQRPDQSYTRGIDTNFLCLQSTLQSKSPN